ncbi:hypothetical protein C8R47DRAFT_979243 [Mycena vitilis]|nr:hypothetical protein C8R47DRAFT_979243 [Mycena vitilis]
MPFVLAAETAAAKTAAATRSTSPPVEPKKKPFPRVEANSGQKPGETMDVFLARRKAQHENRVLHEDAGQKSARLQREKNAELGVAPGRKGARVYVWDLVDGHRIRRAAGRDKYEDVWESYDPDQRIYDSVCNEWDVCEAFGSTSNDSPWDMLPDTIGDNQGPDLHTSMADIDRMHPILELESAPPTTPETAQQLAYLRFGCKMAVERVELPSTTRLPSAKVAAKVLGDKDISLPNDPLTHNLLCFLAQCRDGTSVRRMDKTLLDFHDDNAEVNQMWEMALDRLQCGLRYVIGDTDKPGPLYIVVDSATTALEVVRRKWGPTVDDVARHLLSRGITFRLCLVSTTVDLVCKAPSSRLYSGLGYRSHDYMPDEWDYRAYVDLRTRFLLSCRGQVALRSGGLIARFARDVLSIDDGLIGPIPDVEQHGVCFWDGHSAQAYRDEALTTDEIELICGVYHIATGTNSFSPFIRFRLHWQTGQRDPSKVRNRQITSKSWWPRPAAFAGSALNVGWWTPACEHFYSNRLSKYNSGHFQIETAQTWKEQLKLERKCQPIIQGIEACAADVLKEMRS